MIVPICIGPTGTRLLKKAVLCNSRLHASRFIIDAPMQP